MRRRAPLPIDRIEAYAQRTCLVKNITRHEQVRKKNCTWNDTVKKVTTSS